MLYLRSNNRARLWLDETLLIDQARWCANRAGQHPYHPKNHWRAAPFDAPLAVTRIPTARWLGLAFKAELAEAHCRRDGTLSQGLQAW